MKKYLGLLVVVFLASCSFDSNLPYKPGFMPELPKGSPEFTQGWKDGCATGLAAYGNDVYKTVYRYQKDPAYDSNATYNGAWHDAYSYCRLYANAWDKQVFPNGNTFPSDPEEAENPWLGRSPDAEKPLDTFLSLPTASGFLSLPSTDVFFGTD